MNQRMNRLKYHRWVLVSLAMQSIPSSGDQSAVAFAAGNRPGMTVACSGPESSFESIRQSVHLVAALVVAHNHFSHRLRALSTR